MGGSIDITQGNSSNHFTLSSSDGYLSRTVYENSDGNTFDITGDWSVPDDMLGKELTLEWNVEVGGSSSLSHTLSGLSSPNVTLGRIGSISYNSSISVYEIASVDNFKDLAVYVNGSGTYTTGGEETTAHNCSGMTFKLTQSIEGITTPIGYRASDSDNRPFSGTFLGGGNTIKAKLYWPNSYEGLAPFSYIDNATIKELTVTGGITSDSDKHYTGGLVGFASGTNLIEGCIVTASIGLACNATINNHGGGIVGNGLNSTTTIRNCVFAGEIWGLNSSGIVACGIWGWSENAVDGNNPNVGVIWGWSDSGTPILVNCLEAGTYTNINRMHPMGLQKDAGTIYRCYYVTPQIGSPSNACTLSGARPVANTYNTIPDWMGALIENYGLVTAYANGIFCNGIYYKIADTFENLADGDTYTRTEEEEVTAATYTKTTDRVGKYHAWLLPFDYTIKQADTEKFTFYKINMIANSPDPSQEATDKIWVYVKSLTEGDVLHANMPYVYKPKEAVTDYAFTTENALVKAKNTGVIAKAETLEDIYNFYATYENTTATGSAPFYYVNIDGTISYGTSVTVGPLRWIIRVESKYGETPAYARQMIIFDGEEATSLSEEFRVKSEEFATASEWYTLDGRKLSQKPSRAGVYINNGIKRVIK